MVQFKKKRRFAGVARTHHLLKKVDENFIKRFRLLLGDGRHSALGGTMASAIASGSLRWPVVFALSSANTLETDGCPARSDGRLCSLGLYAI